MYPWRPLLLLTCLLAATGVHAEAAPRFSLPTLDGTGTYTLAQFEGKTIYVDFWASWCVPCRASLPWLAKLREQHEALVVVAITIDRDTVAARQFAEDWLPGQHDLILLSDSDGAIAREFGVPGMPASFLIDRSGAIVWRHSGFRDADIPKLEARVEMALAGDARASARP